MRALLEKIRQKPETHKKGVALGLALALTLVISLGWAGQKGWLGEGSIAGSAQPAESRLVGKVVQPLSPIESSKRSLTSGLSGLRGLYASMRDSVASVFVPFITGIEVYERK